MWETVYLLGAYQPTTRNDGDPNSDVTILGTIDNEIGDGQGANIFMECLNGESLMSDDITKNYNAHTVVHEIGHLFGGEHEHGCIMVQGTEKIGKKFDNDTLEKIRDIDHP